MTFCKGCIANKLSIKLSLLYGEFYRQGRAGMNEIRLAILFTILLLKNSNEDILKGNIIFILDEDKLLYKRF